MMVPPVPAPATRAAIRLVSKSDVSRECYTRRISLLSAVDSSIGRSESYFDFCIRLVEMRQRIILIRILIKDDASRD